MTIAQARRLIAAKDYAAGTALLEDVLLDSGPEERTVILRILKQSYEVMARQAEAAGRNREATHYRDNLAILGVSPYARTPARPTIPLQQPKRTPAPPSVVKDEPKPTEPPQSANSKPVNPSPNQPESGPVLEAPTSLSEPPVVSRPESSRAASAEPLGDRPAVAPADHERGSPIRLAGSTEPSAPAQQPLSPATPDPTQEAPAPSAKTPSPANRPERAQDAPSLSNADRLFSTKHYKEAGQCYAALARDNRLPANRTNHWAYCRIVDVATRMNARPEVNAGMG